VPALGFFAVGVLLLRLMPYALRLGERLTRTAPFGVRLAFLTAARNPTQVAAATTFLAVALGTSLFSLDYRATLDRQAADQARFTAGARWRVAGDVTRLAHATPALRLDGAVDDASAASGVRAVRVVGLPSKRLPDVLGWRDSFSALPRSEIARRLRPRPVRLVGPRLPDGARLLRARARAKTDYAREVVLHFLLPGQRFADVSLGLVFRRARLLQRRIGDELRGAQLIGVEFKPTYVPISFKYDPKGFVDLGPLEVFHGGWSRLATLQDWKESTAPTGTAGILTSTASGIRFELAGTFQPLIHPSFGLPDPRPGFVTGDVPALAGDPVAARAVDGLLTLVVEGKQVPVRVVGSAELFPTVVNRPSDFLVFDYDTLFAALNADQPGLTPPTEAWFFGPVSRPLGPTAVGVERLTARLEHDPLAAGARDVLTVAGILAAVLGLVGLALATRSALAAERVQLAEYEALGVPPRSLRRGAQIRLFALAALGIVAGLLGALLSGQLIAAFVAVTGTARRPLPPIASVVSWPAVAAVLGAVAVAGLATAALLTRRALRELPGRRLRA
jgi:hypothetical protein